MVKRILTGAGFVEGETFKETRFLKPPQTTYAVYMDFFRGRGADNANLIKEHTYTIELYSSKADPTAEAKIEKMFDMLGIEYEKSERYWLDTEQLYQVVFTFYFIEK
jgi:hypothetical protein